MLHLMRLLVSRLFIADARQEVILQRGLHRGHADEAGLALAQRRQGGFQRALRQQGAHHVAGRMAASRPGRRARESPGLRCTPLPPRRSRRAAGRPPRPRPSARLCSARPRGRRGFRHRSECGWRKRWSCPLRSAAAPGRAPRAGQSGSRPLIGSSSSTSLGSCTMACAMPTLCSMPLENLRNWVLAESLMPTRARAVSTLRLRSRASTPLSRA